MRFSFGAIPRWSVADLVALVRIGEELGYDRAWVPDQSFYHDPFVVLGRCAQATSRIRLFLGVANPFSRHPVQIARAAASLDEVADGRFDVGYGAGNFVELLGPLGIEQTNIAGRCREAVVVTKRLLAGQRLEHRSPTLVADGVSLQSGARPGVRVLLAGRGPRILHAAGEVADGVIVGSIASPTGMRYALATVARGAAAAGRSLAGMDVISWGGMTFTDGTESAMEELKPRIAHIVAGHGTPREVLTSVGLAPDRIDALRAVQKERGTAAVAALLTATEVGLFAMVGTPDWLRHRVTELAAVGVTEIGILLQQPTVAEQADFLRRFATEVMLPLHVG